jgi:hypothetical protein
VLSWLPLALLILFFPTMFLLAGPWGRTAVSGLAVIIPIGAFVLALFEPDECRSWISILTLEEAIVVTLRCQTSRLPSRSTKRRPKWCPSSYLP